MNKVLLLMLACFTNGIFLSAQSADEKVIFVIDSIPLYEEPECWDEITPEDIATMNIIRNRDSLKLLGWEQMDAVTYIFTKAYYNRPYGTKGIPGLKQMTMKDGIWYWRDTVYSGKYIDYYNNGKMQEKGSLLNGKLHGQLIVYFKNGNRKSVSTYANGILNGPSAYYYKNGSILESDVFVKGWRTRRYNMYFINGQIQEEIRLKKDTRYDTLIQYYSTGVLKQIKYTKTRQFTPNKREKEIGYYATLFDENISDENIKEANKNFYQLWLLDSSSIETYYREGLLMFNEGRYDKAITSFDLVLAKEPLMRESMLFRGLARYKKYTTAAGRSDWVNIEDMHVIPLDEKVKICDDFLKADDIDQGDYLVTRIVSEAILDFCRSIAHH